MNRLSSMGAQGIILGCAELGRLLSAADSSVPLIDTTRFHAMAAVEEALKSSSTMDLRERISSHPPKHEFGLGNPRSPIRDGYSPSANTFVWLRLPTVTLSGPISSTSEPRASPTRLPTYTVRPLMTAEGRLGW